MLNVCNQYFFSRKISRSDSQQLFSCCNFKKCIFLDSHNRDSSKSAQKMQNICRENETAKMFTELRHTFVLNYMPAIWIDQLPNNRFIRFLTVTAIPFVLFCSCLLFKLSLNTKWFSQHKNIFNLCIILHKISTEFFFFY